MQAFLSFFMFTLHRITVVIFIKNPPEPPYPLNLYCQLSLQMTTSLPSPPSLPPLPSKSKGIKLASPKEMIAHYEAQGMDSQQASLRVIEDLQKALFQKIALNKTKKMSTAGAGDTTVAGISSGRKLDVINSRLMNLDMKVDTKPGYPQTLAIGVASGAVIKGVAVVVPHLVSSVGSIWNSVRNITRGN